jgi:Flp pilus assembly protein TadG
MTPAVFRSFIRDRRANVAMMFGLMIVPLVFVVGMAIDYGAAARLNSKLNAAADSAALAAVSQGVMQSGGGDAASILAAQNMFNAAINPTNNPLGVSLPRLTMDAPLQVVMSHQGLGTSAVVTYHAHSQNVFGSILHWNSLAFSGSSTSNAAVPPNMDFYLLLDTSPSMALPATSAGVTAMVGYTSQQTSDGGQGCAFACHMTVTTANTDNKGNPYVSGSSGPIMDNYALARSKGIALRIDNVQAAAQQLPSAATTAANNPNNVVKPTYRMSFATFDTDIHFISPSGIKTGAGASCSDTYITSNMTQAASLASSSNIQLLQVYSNNYLTSSNNNNDTDTDFDKALTAMNCEMPTPGTGIAPSNPKEVLFFVTDGVEDAPIAGRTESTINSTTWCQTIKNRNILIAVLYTTYLPLNVQPYYSSWYMGHIASFQPNIGTALQACASNGLYYQVSVDGDITAALNNLFQQAIVASAHLTQ